MEWRTRHFCAWASKWAELLNTIVLSDYIHTSNPAPAFPPCGLDTLYIAVPKSVRFTSTFEQLRRDLPRYGQPKEDLRPIGFPLILKHPNYIYGKKASRILQFIGVGGMDSASIVNTLVAVADADPLELRVQRADLCADWSGISIDHCRRSLKVHAKRKTAEYFNPNSAAESCEKEFHESGRYETLYFGSSKSKDYVRIYDKQIQFRNETGIAVPSTWVRFEKALTGDGVPQELRTLGALLQNGSTFDPFADLEISSSFTADESVIYGNPEFTLNQRQNAATTLWAIRQYGMSGAARWLKNESRNPKDLFALLKRVLGSNVVLMPSVFDLTARFQESFAVQMFGNLEPEPLEFGAGIDAPITIPASMGDSLQNLISTAI